MAELNPWDEGYVAPVFDVKELKAAVGRRAGLAAQNAKREKTQAILNGDLDVSDEKAMEAVASKLSKQIATRTEENLSDTEKLRYQDFAVEYMKDMDPTLAWIRAGGKIKSAHVRGRQVLRTPYVQQLIQRVVDACEQENLVTGKQIIMGLWREANHFGDDGGAGSRVRALMGLARIKKMDVQVVEQKTVQHNVMVVPMGSTADDWAKAAAESQGALKAEVRN